MERTQSDQSGGRARPNYPQSHAGGGQARGNAPVVKPDFAAQAVRGGITSAFIDDAENFAKSFSSSNSQVRNIFAAVMKMKGQGLDDNVEEFLMLRPRLAYATKRDQNLGSLREALTHAIEAVMEEKDLGKRKERFTRFCLCCEAIVAYTKK